MASPWDNVSYPRALLVSLGIVVGVTLLYGGLTSTAVFGAYNNAWDGAAELRDLSEQASGETVLAQNTSAYASAPPNASVAIVLSPDSRYSAEEARRVEQFVRAGGTLVVAEDFGNESNRLLGNIGAQARFDGGLLRDERHHDAAPTMPYIQNLTAHPYTTDTEQLTFNRGTTVSPNGTTVLATSTNYSYIDANLNSELDDTETMERYPVATTEALGHGAVVTIGDPSLFINAMLEHEGNRQFARALIAAHDVRLVDVSHVAALPPLVRAQFLLRDSPMLQIGAGVALIILVTYLSENAALAAATRNRLSSGSHSPSSPADEFTPDREALDAWIRQRHPEWDAQRVERVTDRIMGRNEKGEHDD